MMRGNAPVDPTMVMTPEFPRIDRDAAASPHAQEVEYALILSRMVSTVKEDPNQLRLMVYEFARARLRLDTALLEGPERKRLTEALETAIQGVEQFSARREEKERLQPPAPAGQIGYGAAPAGPVSASMVPVSQMNSEPSETLVPKRVYMPRDPAPSATRQARVLLSAKTRFWIGMLLFAVVAVLAINKQRLPVLWAGMDLRPSVGLPAPKSAAPPPVQATPQQTALAAEPKTAVAPASPLPFPLPTDYGVYAVSNTALSELHLLAEQVPDKRIAMSTPLSEPSRTTLPDGRAKFVVFRRDLAGSAPERIDVRVVARVVRALRFDAKGKAEFSPVSDAWNIRNLSYEFRVRPIAGNPEMLLIQSENPDFVLPAGRYALALKTQGYDFTVAGKITDPWQCLERTDAANGTFYSDCQKP
jgi:hypothetical protein